MPSPRSADRPAAQPGHPGRVDALITQTRRLRGGLDAVRREAAAAGGTDRLDGPQLRWQRALCELAAHALDDLGSHLGQLRQGLRTTDEAGAGTGAGAAGGGRPPAGRPGRSRRGIPVSRAGSAEWNLLTDAVTWSDELYEIFGRATDDGPLSLDELPSWVFAEDQQVLTALVTDCLVDGKPIDGEFRIVRADGVVRTVHMVGEPVLGQDGGAASLWAVLRDVSELRRSQRAARETYDAWQRERHLAQTERRMAVELQEAVLPSWRGSQLLPHDAGGLDLAAHYLPSATSALIGGDWYEALELPDGATLLSVGDLTGHGVTATSGMAMLLGALRGMAVAGVQPAALMGCLNQLLDTTAQPALGSALCGRYDPATATLVWSQAGHPAPLLFRGGTGRALSPPDGVLLGATSGARYGQATEQLAEGDLLVLHTDGLSPRSAGADSDAAAERLLDLAPRFAAARSARACVRTVVEAFGDEEREDDACVLVARVGPPAAPDAGHAQERSEDAPPAR